MHYKRNRHNRIMSKMGEVMENNHSDFVDMMDSANINVSSYDAPEVLASRYIEELPHNDQLRVLTSYIIANEDASSFDGTIANEDVYQNFEIIHDYWDDDYSNFDPVTAIATAVGEGVKLGGKITDSRQKKKFGATNLAEKKAEARQELLKGAMAQKQAKAEAEKIKAETKAKNKRILIIGGSVVLGIVAIATTIYFVMKNRSK